MTSSLRRGRHLLALALASTTVVVAAGASAASAAPAGTSTTSTLFSGQANASVVQLVLTLPSALTAVTGAVLPNPIDLSLISSAGKVSHDGKTPDVSTNTEGLATGSLVTNSALSPVLGALAQNVTSSLDTPSPAPFSLLTVPTNPLGLNLALTPLTATTDKSSKATTAAGGVASSTLGSLSALAPQVVTPLTGALDTVNGGLQSAISQLTAALAPGAAGVATATSALNTALQALPPISIPGTPLTPPVTLNLSQLIGSIDDPTAVINTLNNLPAIISKVENDLLTGAAISLDGVSSSDNVTPSGTGTTSTAAANVATINLFGGLLQVEATKASATASAPGTTGKAASDSTATLVKVQVGTDLDNLLTLIADDQGLGASLVGGLAGSALAPLLDTVNMAVNSVLATVTGLLADLNSGAKILQQGTTTHSVTADGTHAEAAATPAQIVVGLPGAPNLLALSLGNVSVVANNEKVTTNTPSTVAVKPPTVAKVPGQSAKPVAPTKKLAYTGADLPLTAGAALVLLGAAAGIARRRRNQTV